MDRNLSLLKALVAAHAIPEQGTAGERTAILYLRFQGGAVLRHDGFAGAEPPPVDDTALEDLRSQGLVDIDYHANSWTITPTLAGRRMVEQLEAIERETPLADLAPFVAAFERQGAASNMLAWPAVRPILVAFDGYWQAAGFPASGIPTLPFIAAVPEGSEGRLVATVQALIDDGYLTRETTLALSDLPAMVGIGGRARSVLAGWPGASRADLVENLDAVLTERASDEDDPERRRRIEKWKDGIREVGVTTAGEVLSKVLTGGF